MCVFREDWEFLGCQDIQDDRGRRQNNPRLTYCQFININGIINYYVFCIPLQGGDGFPGGLGPEGEKGKKVSSQS